MKIQRRSALILLCILSSGLLFAGLTRQALRPLPRSLAFTETAARKLQILDRNAVPLTVTYQNEWNLHDNIALHQIPEFLQSAFVIAEDKRFYQHGGVDWRARFHAMWQNLLAGRIVRGASTISEQSVRMLHPRPRVFWSRWLETFEAAHLEARFSKDEILEFYLNQVPYSAQRRGVVQAARYYFNRDLTTLNRKEMLALAILVRSPGRLNLHRGTSEIQRPMEHLARRMEEEGRLSAAARRELLQEPFELQKNDLPAQAVHFVNYLYQSRLPEQVATLQGRLRTTLDADIQMKARALLDERLRGLHEKGVQNGALLVVEHSTNEVLAWVNAGDFSAEVPGSRIDAVTTPRQPGSTLKPFLYALALEKGRHAATLIDDSPLTEAVGSGLHTYHNYSRMHYGPLRLRDALGNSLNIPAVRTVRFTGVSDFLDVLHDLGFMGLERHPDFYGDGLALGNGEVTLLELVRAYAVLANRGVYRPLKLLAEQPGGESRRVFSKESASLIADILSDPDARRLEFGSGALLRFPVQTAIKTGTSSAYHDAWAVAFNHRYVVGAWVGNLDRRPMLEITGSTGPALILRAMFAELNRHHDTAPLYLSPELRKIAVCREDGRRADKDCPSRMEWFAPGSVPTAATAPAVPSAPAAPRLSRPSEGLHLAMDPRIPDAQEQFTLRLSPNVEARRVEWLINGHVVGESAAPDFSWPLRRGTHYAQARVMNAAGAWDETPAVKFYVH